MAKKINFAPPFANKWWCTLFFCQFLLQRKMKSTLADVEKECTFIGEIIFEGAFLSFLKWSHYDLDFISYIGKYNSIKQKRVLSTNFKFNSELFLNFIYFGFCTHKNKKRQALQKAPNNIWTMYSKLPIKRPVLLNDLVWIFQKSLY